jgi:hypothetical protein
MRLSIDVFNWGVGYRVWGDGRINKNNLLLNTDY